MSDAKDISLNGKCTLMDAPARTFRIKDETGAEHPFKWTEPLDVVMIKNGSEKWKVGYYLTVTYDPDSRTVKNVSYWQEGKDKFPKDQRGGSGKSWQMPRNEKAIMFECCLKAMVDLYLGRLGNNSSGQSFETSVDSVIEAAKKATEAGITASGLNGGGA